VEIRLEGYLRFLDNFTAFCVAPLVVWIFISGLDDLLIALAFVYSWLRKLRPPVTDSQLRSEPEKRIAILVALWQEHEVIGSMIRHNVASLEYSNYDFFLCTYPNDEETVAAVAELEESFPNVHLAICPHDGPTSKSDCLNWVYQNLLLFEQQRQVRFEILVIHDAEDVIHPAALKLINYYSREWEMIQVPVLPLRTSLFELTHGVYCDEFAEYQIKDIPARQTLGGFIPSNGVGTGFRRDTIEKLASCSSNRVFEPECLTEDYEIGLKLHELRCRQLFVPVQFQGPEPMATREFFPRTFRSALQQRTRWITGIALQSWERHGWRGGVRRAFWFWRDRKGVVGNPLSAFANLLLLYVLLTWAAGHTPAVPRSDAIPPFALLLLPCTLFLQIFQLVFRTACATRIYGPAFAAGVLVRSTWANVINSIATVLALHRYTRAKWRREPLRWLKTEHTYPSLASLTQALAGFVPINIDEVPAGVLRALPAHLVEKWQVLPFKVAAGSLHLAGPHPPPEGFQADIRRFTNLRIRFHLVDEPDFEELKQRLG